MRQPSNRKARRYSVGLSRRWGRAVTVVLLVLAAANCSAGPRATPDGGPRAERPIEPGSGEVDRQKFESAMEALEAGEWERAKEAFRLIQARESSGEVAQLAELYVARAEIGSLEKLEDAKVSKRPRPSRQRARQMLASLASDAKVDGRIRRAARVYGAYVEFARGNRTRAFDRLERHPDGKLGSAVLEQDRLELWPVLVEGLAGADRHLLAIYAAGGMFQEVRRRRADKTNEDDADVVAGPGKSSPPQSMSGRSAKMSKPAEDRSGGSDESERREIPTKRAATLIAFARSGGFSSAAQLSDRKLEKNLDVDSGFVRAVVGWMYLDRALDANKISSKRRKQLDKRFAEVGADLNAIGAPNRASELSIKLATVGGGKRLVIGALLPLSGANQSVGQRALSGMLLAMRSFRHAGPSRVTLVFENSNANPKKVLERFEKLEAAAVVGPLDPARGDAYAAEAQKRKLPMIALTAREPKVSETQRNDKQHEGETASNRERRPIGKASTKGRRSTKEKDSKPWVVRNFMDPLTEARAAANLAFHQFGDRRAVIVRPNIGYGEKTAEAFEKEFRSLGGQMATTITYERGKSNYSSAADKLAATNAEAVFIPDSASKVAELSAFFADRDVWGIGPSEQKERGSDRHYVHYLGTSLWHGPILERQAASYVDGAVIPTWYAPGFGDSATRQFTTRFKAVFGRRPGNIEAFAYDNVRWVRRLMVEHGVQTPRALRASMLGASPYLGATGRGQFQADGTLRRTIRFVRVAEEGFEPLEMRVEITPEGGDHQVGGAGRKHPGSE